MTLPGSFRPVRTERLVPEAMDIKFSFKYFPIEIEKEKFRNSITSYIDMLEKKVPPPPPKDCGAKKCFAHKFFYDEKKLIKEGERVSFSVGIGSSRGDRHSFSIRNLKIFFEENSEKYKNGPHALTV